MTKTSMRILAAMSLVIASSLASAQTTASPAEPVTVENYNRAQTDVNFAGVVKNGGFGKFRHGRELAPPVQQGIVRPNRDTLYSFAIVDLDAGPVTITLPEAGKRYMGMQVVNQDQYTPATYYGAGTHTLTREMIGARYAIAVVRFLVDFSRMSGKSTPCRMRSSSARNAPARSKPPIGMRQASKRCKRRSCSLEPRFPIRVACLAPTKMRSTRSS